MFCVLPPCSVAEQPPLPLPLLAQVVRCWKIAMPEVVPLVGATMLTVGLPVTLGAPGLPLLLTNTIVTPPDVSFGHSVEDIGGVVAGGIGPACGGAFTIAFAVSVRLEPLLKT